MSEQASFGESLSTQNEGMWSASLNAWQTSLLEFRISWWYFELFTCQNPLGKQ